MGIFAVGLVFPGSNMKDLWDSIPVCVAPGLWHEHYPLASGDSSLEFSKAAAVERNWQWQEGGMSMELQH